MFFVFVWIREERDREREQEQEGLVVGGGACEDRHPDKHKTHHQQPTSNKILEKSFFLRS